jgi:hypothetical protein
MHAGRVCLCVGPVLFCLLDGGLTLQGQPDAYWAGDFHQARELNPLGRWPLERHPLLFGAALLCWGCVFCTAILRLPARLARPLSLAVQLGHTLGAASWLVRLGVPGWLLVFPLLLASRLVFDWAWKRSALLAKTELGHDPDHRRAHCGSTETTLI